MTGFTHLSRSQILWLLFCLSAIALTYFLTEVPSQADIFFSNFGILAISSIGLSKRPKRHYSLTKVVYLFCFFFFGVVPLNDAAMSNQYWGGSEISPESYLETNVLIIIGLIVFLLTESFSFKAPWFMRSTNPNAKATLFSKLLLLFLSISASLIIGIHFGFDLISIIARGASTEFASEAVLQDSESISERLFFGVMIRPIPIVALLLFSRIHLHTEYNLYDRLIFSILFLLAFFFVAPTSVSRFMAATLYIPMLIAYTKLWERPYAMQASLFIAILVVMPILDQFRYFNPNDIKFSLSLEALNQGHFDAYQNFARAVELGFHSNGRQLIGALLFFVPRTIWEDKPIGSGAQMAEDAGLSFSNISMPFMGEGYVNFGIAGVVLFMLVLGFLAKWLDDAYWKRGNLSSHPIFSCYYHLLLGLCFFMMRGDLLSSVAFIAGISGTYFLIGKLLSRTLKSVRISTQVTITQSTQHQSLK